MDKLALTPVDRFTVPLGGQQIELQQADYAVGGISLLRIRIREGRRFTVFDIDPDTARALGASLLRWGSGAGARIVAGPSGNASLHPGEAGDDDR